MNEGSREKTYVVAAGMDVELSGHGNGTAEEEEGVESVDGHHDEGVDHEGFLDRGGDEVKQRQHRNNRHEHVVVDD